MARGDGEASGRVWNRRMVMRGRERRGRCMVVEKSGWIRMGWRRRTRALHAPGEGIQDGRKAGTCRCSSSGLVLAVVVLVEYSVDGSSMMFLFKWCIDSYVSTVAHIPQSVACRVVANVSASDTDLNQNISCGALASGSVIIMGRRAAHAPHDFAD